MRREPVRAKATLLVAFLSSVFSVVGCAADEPPRSDNDVATGVPSCDNVDARECDARKAKAVSQTAPVSDYSMGDFEYWPYAEPEPLYPAKIRWGYASGSEPAQRCASASLARLTRILEEPPAELLALSTSLGTRAFFQSNNDYTGAKAAVTAPASQRSLWLYNGGLIKWVSETNRDGTCTLPTRDDLVNFARHCAGKPAGDPMCRNWPRSG